MEQKEVTTYGMRVNVIYNYLTHFGIQLVMKTMDILIVILVTQSQFS